MEKPKNRESTVPKLLKRQRRGLTSMYPSTPIHLLLSETSLIPTNLLLDFWQKSYTYQLLTLPNCHLTKQILPIYLREGDKNIQPGEQPKNILI